ncbi:MAG: anti-sigma factor family protein, partial [Burkholderiales bacterium]
MTEAQLHAYVDGLLPESERAKVEDYLSARPEVAERIDAYRRQNASLHELFDPVLQEPIPERLRVAAAATKPSAMRYAAMLAWVAIGVVVGWAVNEFTQTRESMLAQRAAVA